MDASELAAIMGDSGAEPEDEDRDDEVYHSDADGSDAGAGAGAGGRQSTSSNAASRRKLNRQARQEQERAQQAAAVNKVIALAERYFDRVDPAQLLELLPSTTPVAALLRYCKIVMEYGSAKKRNMQVSGERVFYCVFIMGFLCRDR